MAEETPEAEAPRDGQEEVARPPDTEVRILMVQTPDSSNVRGIGYDPRSETFAVWFGAPERVPTQYRYGAVPWQVAQAGLDCITEEESIGHWVNVWIKALGYAFEKMPPRDEEEGPNG